MSTKSELVEDRYLDTVFNQLDFQKEILESDKRLFMITAGVGAGKNHWVKTLTEPGHEDKGYKSGGYNVLLITSRKSTVTAQAIKLSAEKNFHFADLFYNHNELGELVDAPPAVYCCTNSYIEYYCKNLYNPDDPITHIWNAFDFIIWDEAHSLVFDAAFSEAPFYVLAFLQHVRKISKRCRIVMMSGTPDAVSYLYDTPSAKKQVKSIDLYDKCRHVEAEKVLFRSKAGLAQFLAEKIKEGKRAIYFATTSNNMKRLIEQLQKEGIIYSDMAIAYSDDEVKDSLFPEELVNKRKAVQDYLNTEEQIHPDVKIFITTSKNKEGININNTDIPYMIVESHQRDEIRQMVGRVRNGVKYLIIIADAQQHPNHGSDYEYQLNRKNLEGTNAVFMAYSSDPFDVEEKKRNVGITEKIFRYVRYNYFTQRFELYKARRKGEKLFEKSEKEFRHNWALSFDGQEEYIMDQRHPGSDFFECPGRINFSYWFPYSQCYFSFPVDYEENARKIIEEAINSGETVTKEERDALIKKLTDLATRCGVKTYKQPNKILNPLGYTMKIPKGEKHTGKTFLIRPLEKPKEAVEAGELF